ncbi:hypothetical protein [Salinibacterium sp. SWN248]|uniref:hypothetical protein n=1 Tax=Salinibacterium sp. SWN248 TaxID=2792056 RepID=UPI0018CE6295|nr:hypothetical protein [Salinibacterium sp. SWN248]MBH0023451.1 hypothetical protein [Salinibacterium sp. SWN248]
MNALALGLVPEYPSALKDQFSNSAQSAEQGPRPKRQRRPLPQVRLEKVPANVKAGAEVVGRHIKFGEDSYQTTEKLVRELWRPREVFIGHQYLQLPVEA